MTGPPIQHGRQGGSSSLSEFIAALNDAMLLALVVLPSIWPDEERDVRPALGAPRRSAGRPAATGRAGAVFSDSASRVLAHLLTSAVRTVADAAGPRRIRRYERASDGPR